MTRVSSSRRDGGIGIELEEPEIKRPGPFSPPVPSGTGIELRRPDILSLPGLNRINPAINHFRIRTEVSCHEIENRVVAFAAGAQLKSGPERGELSGDNGDYPSEFLASRRFGHKALDLASRLLPNPRRPGAITRLPTRKQGTWSSRSRISALAAGCLADDRESATFWNVGSAHNGSSWLKVMAQVVRADRPRGFQLPGSTGWLRAYGQMTIMPATKRIWHRRSGTQSDIQFARDARDIQSFVHDITQKTIWRG